MFARSTLFSRAIYLASACQIFTGLWLILLAWRGRGVLGASHTCPFQQRQQSPQQHAENQQREIAVDGAAVHFTAVALAQLTVRPEMLR